MVDFDKLLQESLLGVNKAFEQADADLHELVAAASQALGRVSNGVVAMKLRKWLEGPGGVFYELRVEEEGDFTAKSDSVVVGAYMVSTKGYPVFAGVVTTTSGGGDIDPTRPNFRSQENFPDKLSLQVHFEKLMSNPDSPVIANASFFMRRAATST